jgi:DNA polymerase III epsilon subunit-like protein
MTEETQEKPGRRLLFVDVETTGLVNDGAELKEWHNQPHITQVAALLVDEKTRKDMAVFSTLIQPRDGRCDFEIPEEITEKTGITREACVRYGIRMLDALDLLSTFAAIADAWGAFNRRFDGQDGEGRVCQVWGGV